MRRSWHKLGFRAPPGAPRRRLILVRKVQETKEDGRYIIYYSFEDEEEE